MKNLATETTTYPGLSGEKTKRNTAKKHFRMSENEVAKIIIGCATKVHKFLGPGLPKAVYEECMGYALSKTVLEIERRKPLLSLNEEEIPDNEVMLDFVANKKVILEIKSTDGHENSHLEKIQSGLRLSGCKAGLLIDFSAKKLTNGIKRVINSNYRCRSLQISPGIPE